MITCTVCGNGNDDLSVVCTSCKSFLQARVDALDLFSTIGGLIEKPRATYKKIVLARHKNYAVLLSGLFGVSFAFDVAWLRGVGNIVPSLITIVGAATLAGPIAGVLVVFMASLLVQQATRMFGGNATRRNLFAALAYAVMPMVLALVFVIPLQLAVFGLEFFGTNPPPSLVRPTEYYLLVGLKGLAAVWTLYLMIEATMAATGFDRKRVFSVTLIVLGLVTIGGVGVGFLKF